METGHSILWEQFFHLEIGPLIIWELDHLTSGNRTSSFGIRDILWETGHGNGTRYPLGFGPLILWETSSGNREFGR